jgi:enamine deaminase RidA (YjgF/YER057c/UK114 family)
VVGADVIMAQVRKVLPNVRAVLARIDGTTADVVSLVHYTTDIEAFIGAGDLCKKFFSPRSQ